MQCVCVCAVFTVQYAGQHGFIFIVGHFILSLLPVHFSYNHHFYRQWILFNVYLYIHTLLPLVFSSSFIIVIFLMYLFGLKKLLCVFDWVFHHFHKHCSNHHTDAVAAVVVILLLFYFIFIWIFFYLSIFRLYYHIMCAHLLIAVHACLYEHELIDMDWLWTTTMTTMQRKCYKVIMLW